MLRALGIVFIVCSVLFMGLLVTGLGWWAIASGTVQIAGINDASAGANQAVDAPQSATFGQPVTAAPLGPAVDPPVAAPRVLHRASFSTPVAAGVPAATQAISVSGLNVNDFPEAVWKKSDSAPPKLDSEKLEKLRQLQLVRITGKVGSTHVAWAATDETVPFPKGTTQVYVYLRNTNNDDMDDTTVKLVKEIVASNKVKTDVKYPLVLRSSDGQGPTVTGDAKLMCLDYSTSGVSSHVELGIRVPGRGLDRAVARVDVNIRPREGRAPEFLGFYNGDRQPLNQPLTLSDNPVRLFAPYLRFRFSSAGPPGDARAYLMKLNSSDKPGSPDEQLSTVHPLSFLFPEIRGPGVYSVTLRGADNETTAGSNHLFGLQHGESAVLFITTTDANGTLVSAPQKVVREIVIPDAVGGHIKATTVGGLDPMSEPGLYLNSDGAIEFGVEKLQQDYHYDLVLTTSAGSVSKRLARDGTVSLPLKFAEDGPQKITAQLRVGTTDVGEKVSHDVTVLKTGPRIVRVDSSAFRNTADGNTITLYFDREHPLDDTIPNKDSGVFELSSLKGGTAATLSTVGPGDVENSIVLTFRKPLNPGRWKLTVRPNAGGAELKDKAGNLLNKDDDHDSGAPYTEVLTRSGLGEEPVVAQGLGDARTGEHIEFPEYTEPRDYPAGFNPSDKVVTRVARLYYFRDAHRVTQIINRKAKSYNRQAVDMKQQFADAARREFEEAVGARRELERKAVRAAQEARAAEEALEEHQRALIESRRQDNQLTQVLDGLSAQIEEKELLVAGAEDASTEEVVKLKKEVRHLKRQQQVMVRQQQAIQLEVQREEASVRQLLTSVQAERRKEISATERWEAAEEQERLKATEEHRRSAAAKTEDPDTYVPGVLDSNDPVSQVSISVVGEGLIQLRGPRKGVNEVHKMINQIDAPVGQVKVALHTVQVNGEGGDRMEKVVTRIQRYLDHSRFLTVQSGQMLRNAVVRVASQRANSIADTCPPGMPQELRDYKYQEAFFGQEFMQELRSMDSEFLRTGNKVLSLHSMDTTSLSNSLFLLALAKNDVREQILAEFMGAVQCKLPQDELDFFTESGAEFRFRHKDFQFLGHNAKFTALRGFFDAQVAGPDTLNPMQREFIRLAQIFKARLITEIELRQRVMERALIEERIGTPEDYRNQLRLAQQAEQKAQQDVNKLRLHMRRQLGEIVGAVEQISVLVQWNKVITTENNRRQKTIDEALAELQQVTDRAKHGQVPPEIVSLQTRYFVRPALDSLDGSKALAEQGLSERAEAYRIQVNNARQKEALSSIDQRQWTGLREEYEQRLVKSAAASQEQIDVAFKDLQEQLTKLQNTYNLQNKYVRYAADAQALIDEQAQLQKADSRMTDGNDSGDRQQLRRTHEIDRLNRLSLYVSAIQEHTATRSEDADSSLRNLLEALRKAITAPDGVEQIPGIVAQWQAIYGRFSRFVEPGTVLFGPLTTANQGFEALETGIPQFTGALAYAQEVRRPLDHKKFLDLLVDDVEEKFIELVEGTRAQTSNIDNYLKRLGTALEDDFNAQFYHPAFRHVRETSYFHDVNVGQVETTSVVANNRMFAKVSPQATMEFDLPKRDILINEAMNSALAAYNDYGALMGDPNFLSLMKLYGGQPASNTFGQQLGSPYVQEVLPGLPSGTDAQFLTSARNNVPRIGSNLEALIPDPAIYKFETGTGYEIRPVIQPDGQSVVFHLDYMYTTNVREPVRADEKHLGRVKRHFINTDVVSGNYELREVSTYRVGLKASRTSRGVPLLEDAPGIGVLFRPQASDESSLQQNIILTQSVIYPTLFDLMGLRWAPAVADLDSLSLQEREFVARNREKFLQNEVFDYASRKVDDVMRIPNAERRGDLYRTQETIPRTHPNGYSGKGLNIRNGQLQEGYSPEQFHPQSQFVPRRSEDATFSQEKPPKQPVYKAPLELVPGIGVPVESIEGAIPLGGLPEGLHVPSVVTPMSWEQPGELVVEDTAFAVQPATRQVPVAEPTMEHNPSDKPATVRRPQQQAQPRPRRKKRNRVSRFFHGLFQN